MKFTCLLRVSASARPCASFSYLAAVLIALAMPAAEAHAQRDDQFAWGLGAGATIPSGAAKDNHKAGAHASLMFGIGSVDSPFGIRFDAFYSALGDGPRGNLAIDQGEATLFTLMMNGLVNVYGSNRRLYALAGAGGFWYDPDGAGTVAVNDFGVAGGLGVWLPGINGFVEAKILNLYNALPDPVTGARGRKSAQLFPITLGIMF